MSPLDHLAGRAATEKWKLDLTVEPPEPLAGSAEWKLSDDKIGGENAPLAATGRRRS